MNDKAKISILIPAYRAEAYIQECLDSIESQSYFLGNSNYEIIIGIDGCQETLTEVRKIRARFRNLRVYMMKDNKGVYVTLNTLFSIVEDGNIIIFNADDVMRTNMVEKIAKYIPDFDVVRFYCQSFVGQVENTSDIVLSRGCIFFKKKVYDKLGGFKPWVCGADLDFVYRAESLFPEKRILEVLFYYRRHSESLTQNPLTGLDSDLRKNYHRQLSKSFEYIEPVTNFCDEII